MALFSMTLNDLQRLISRKRYRIDNSYCGMPIGNRVRSMKRCKRKVKEVDFYSAFIVVPHTQGAQVRITQCYLQITPYLPLPRKHSPDGASPD